MQPTNMNSESETQRQLSSSQRPADPPTEKDQDKKKNVSRKSRLYILVAVLVSLLLVVLVAILLLRPSPQSAPASFKKNATKHRTESNKTSSRELIFAQILFRHGARSGPQFGTNFSSFFPRGPGQLTDRGYNHSHLLGKFLKKRYVDSGFLDAGMRSKEMYWRSRAMARCLSTASTVGAAMFQTEKRKNVHVAVVSHERSVDELLNIGRCLKTRNLFIESCPAYKNRTSANQYSVLYKCLGRNHPIFQNHSIDESDKFINAWKNGYPVPDDIKKNIDAIEEEYLMVRNVTNGIGNVQITRLRFGPFVDTLLNDLLLAWNGHLEKKKGMRKFKAYSTQDWVISGILEGFGVFDHVMATGRKAEPAFNSMIVIELWKVDGTPIVKFFYKPEEITKEDHEMKDLTMQVANCPEPDCPLEKFVSCCNEVRTTVAKRHAECAGV